MSFLPAMAGTTQRIVRGQASILIDGDTHERPLGSCKLGLTVKTELQDLRTNEERTRPIIDQVVTDLNGEIDGEFYSADPFIMAVTHAAVPYENWTQVAMANGTKQFANVRAGDRTVLRDNAGNRLYNVIVGEITPAGAARVDARTGRVAFLVDAANVTIAFTAAEITDQDRKHFMRFFSKPLIRGTFMLQQDNAEGTNYDYTFPRVTFSTSGTINLVQNDNAVSSIQTKMQILFDPTQKPGFERGWATAIGDPA
ncbi:hypothetical protein [Methylobacterium sp. MA0201]|uniref:hypothetical protein n=1 Tax=Methylobacterium alsaeris TaxID=3344826 RepID=UPI003756D796